MRWTTSKVTKVSRFASSWRRHIWASLIAVACAIAGAIGGADRVQAQAQDGSQSRNAYVFGNSLVHHLTDSDETSVPHWMALLARAAGTELALDGQWGFLRDFAKDLPPQANWRFDAVPRAWTRQFRNFGDVDWDVMLITPANFIQYQDMDRPYDGDNPDKSSPLSATLAVIDRMQTTAAPERFVIYEGWADMGRFGRSFPPNARQFQQYQRHNAGAYHDWYRAYLAALRTERPDVQIDLIPVAQALAELLDGGVLDGLPPEVFYTDDAPHGTATLYFLAGAITYVGLFESALPLEISLPDTVHADVRLYWEAVRDEIHRLILRPIQIAKAAPPQDQARPSGAQISDTPNGMGLADPALAMGLSGISDWSTQHPFLNHMKTARPWVGHLPDQWGGVSAEDLEARGFLDADGWVWGLPEDITSVEALLLTNQPPEGTALAGAYQVTWQGTGTVELTGRARVTRSEEREIWFDYTPGEGPVGIKITQTDPDRVGDYIHNITVVAERHMPLAAAGAVFNPDWLAVVHDLRMVRFMDWMQTNGSTQSTWEGRPQPSDFSYGWRGVPVEVMVQLANEIGADPWFTMPHLADETYLRSFATYARDHLDVGLRAHVEYSNELWNWGFEQAQWALQQGEARWGEGAHLHMQFAGLKAAEMGRIWAQVYDQDADARLVRVMSTHTDWPGLEKALLQAPLVQAEGLDAPVTQADAYGVTGYFGVTLGLDDGAEMLLGWLADTRAAAERAGRAEGLQRAALEAFVAKHKFDRVFAQAADHLRRTEVAALVGEALPYQAAVARDNDLALVMYEGGSHAVGVGVLSNDDRLTDFFAAFSSSDELGALYKEVLTRWRTLGGQSFNAFTDVGQPSKWGSWGHLRHLWDETPRHTAVMAYNQTGPHWHESRQDGVFLHGGVFKSGAGGGRLEGTAKRDVLLGGDGNDVLVARGTGDVLYGGAGTDRAILPGARGDYTFTREGDRVRARAPKRSYLLTQIETVGFGDTPALVLPLGGLL